MKKLFPLIVLVLVFTSCDFVESKYNQFVRGETPQGIDSIIVNEDIDTLALTLDALRKKRVPGGYQVVDDVKTDLLTYVGFYMNDVPQYTFTNAEGEEFIFSSNDTNFILEIKSQNPTKENKGLEANSRYLNKEFRVVWRNLILTHAPQNETEFYNQEVVQIIFLQEQTRFPVKEFK